MHFVVENSYKKHYNITNRPATPLPKGKRNHGGFFYWVDEYWSSVYCIPFQSIRDVFLSGSTFRKIAKLYRLDAELHNAMPAFISPVEVHFGTRMVYKRSYGLGVLA